MYTQSWWEQAQIVALVRVNAVHVAAQQPFSSSPCVKGEPCAIKQVATFTTIETFKGSINGVPTLSSGYGGGDCGMPIVAGAFFVVFLNRKDGDIGFCNAAGPYPMQYPFKGRYPEEIEPFVASLRKAAKDPKAKVAPRPKPMPYDSTGGI